MPNLPTLSVVLTNFNHGKLLRRSLPALAAQTRLPDEWILIDDASTDDSRELLAEFARHHPSATVVHHEQNRGVVASILEGLRRARGDYIYFAASDDIALPELFARLMGALEAHPGAGLALADFFVFGEGCGGATRRRQVSLANRATYLDGPAFGRLLVTGASFHYPPSAAIVHRETLLTLGGHDPKVSWLADWWINLQVGLRQGVCLVPEALAGFHADLGSFSGAGTKKAPDAAMLWSLATVSNASETERLWLGALAAAPADTRRQMWQQVFCHPRGWPWFFQHWWRMEGWPKIRPWLWPVMQLLLRALPALLYPPALRTFGATIAENVRIAHGITIDRPWRLRLDEGAVLEAGVRICARAAVVIGAGAKVERDCVIDSSVDDQGQPAADTIIIGPGASLGESSQLYAGTAVAAKASIPARSEMAAANAPDPARRLLEAILGAKPAPAP